MFKKLVFLVSILFVVFIVIFYVLFNQKLDQALKLKQDSFITVTKGSSIGSFSAQLVKKGWIENRFWLRNFGRLYPQKALIKVGTYKVNVGLSSRELLAQVVAGKEHQFSITFIEGTTFKQWLTLLSNQPKIKQTINLKNIKEFLQKLGIEQKNPEGWFFPDTYAYTAFTTDVSLLTRAYKKMTMVLDEQWVNRQIGLPYSSPYQALIMASIIEKETSYLPEQPLVASVFVNRLNKKMRLQTDPTIIYGLGDRYTGDITRANLREKTLYNTYRINGLPPTPIAMAGVSALKSALNPASSDYFYFVSNGEGEHTFSQTLAEHNKAVQQFLRNQKHISN